MKLSYGYNAAEHIGLGLRIGLMKKALVSVAGGAGLVGVNSRNDKNLVLYLLRQPCKAGYVIEYGDGIVGRAGTYNQYKTVVLSRKDAFDLLCTIVFDRKHIVACGIHRL